MSAKVMCAITWMMRRVVAIHVLQKILRDEMGFKYLVVSDCGAITDFFTSHKDHLMQFMPHPKAFWQGTDVGVANGLTTLIKNCPMLLQKV